MYISNVTMAIKVVDCVSNRLGSAFNTTSKPGSPRLTVPTT